MRLATPLLFAALVSPLSASAHRLGRSFADVREREERVDVLLDLDADDLQDSLHRRMDDDGSGRLEIPEMQKHVNLLSALAAGGLRIDRGEASCHPKVTGSRGSAGAGMIRVTMSYRCDEAGPLRIAYPLVDRLRRGHVHFLTVRLEGGVQTATLSANNRVWYEQREPGVVASIRQFFLLGLEHILIGYDHLLFLFALLLLPARLLELVRIVTAFTVAHSITLIAAALGVVALPAWIVEPAIASTIAYVGVENYFLRSAARRWMLTFALGLVHGFGFASILAETGLPREGRVLSLLAFNIGVEAGQLAVVLLVVPALGVLRRPAISRRARVLILAGAFIAAAALFRFEPFAAVGLAAIALGIVACVPTWGYRRIALQGGSAVVVLLGLIWFVLRLL